MAKMKKKIKTIKVDADKCNGCQSCEIICSTFHATPKYSSINPARSRIQVIRDPMRDVWLPVFAGEYVEAECMGRQTFVIDGKEYSECDFCRASCPARERFTEPDSGLPLRCDMCEENGPGQEPLCVQWCFNDALKFEEREVEVEEDVKLGDLEIGLKSLLDKHGLQKLAETFARMTQKS
ncbi:MAG: 4Fe-4S dicluster domain-containing protein [Desulfitobacteriaceae bacterium]